MTDRRLDRRSFLAGGASSVAALSALSAVAAQAAADGGERPNILWFITEDNNPFIGAYGDPVANTPTMDRLAQEGVRYETVHSAAPVCAPSRFALITGKYAESCGPAHHMRAIAKMPSYVRGFPEFLRAAGYYCTNNAKTDYNAQIDIAATWDASGGQAHWRDRPAGGPFFAQFTTLGNHESQLFGNTPLTTRPEDVRIPAYLPDTPTTREDRARSYSNMTRVDAQLAARLAELEADGLRVPLIIRFPEKWRHVAPGRPGSVVEAPVSCLDLPATALTLAGLPVPEYMDGRPLVGNRATPRRHVFGQRSRMDERYDLQRTVRDERYIYVRNYMPHRPYGQSMGYMWQQRGYQVWEQMHLDGDVTAVQERFWDEKPSEELYDLDRDPDEVRNLVHSDKHRDELHRLRRALDEHMLDTNDNGLIPEGSPLEGFEQSRVPGAFPIRRVMRVAEMAIERDPQNLDHLLSDLEDDNDVVRFWAAQGILMLGDDGQPAVEALRERLESDPSVHVRIVVAEALASLGHSGRPVDFLAETIDTHENPRVKLQALNAFTYVGVAALRHMPVVERAATSGDEYVRNAGRYLRFVLTGTYTPASPIFGGF